MTNNVYSSTPNYQCTVSEIGSDDTIVRQIVKAKHHKNN